jgi:DNA-binding MarR family transcriptional regulator
MPRIAARDYRALASFRHEIRKFLAFSEEAARNAGIEPQQHQLLLAVRGLPEGVKPTIGAIAERLCVQHHTVVALADKVEARGLLDRERGSQDRRQVLLRLTDEGETLLRGLSALHQRQLKTIAPALVSALQRVLGESGSQPEATMT